LVDRIHPHRLVAHSNLTITAVPQPMEIATFRRS